MIIEELSLEAKEKTKFKKFGSLISIKDKKTIAKWLNVFPELEAEKYIVRSKIDGSNFSILITKDSIEYARRTDKLLPDEKFYDYQNVVKRYNKDILKIQKYVIEAGINQATIYCELFGKGVINRIKYFDEKMLRIIAIEIDGLKLSPEQEIYFLNFCHLDGLNVNGEEDNTYREALVIAPALSIVDGLEKALEYESNFKSIINKNAEGDNIEEGIVIQPYHETYIFPNSVYDSVRTFVIKKVNAEFSDTGKHKTDFKIPEISDDDQILIDKAIEFTNVNRLMSVYSKFTPIDDAKNIRKYTSIFIEDVINDLKLAFNDDNLFTKAKTNLIKKTIGNSVSTMLLNTLRGIENV